MLASLSGGGLIVICKVWAYFLCGSLAVMADMMESLVHNLAVVFAAYCLWVSHRPADRNHLYGHGKIQFFSSGLEGALICGAAILIWVQSWRNWLIGYEMANVREGLILVAFAMVFNAILGWFLLWRGKQQQSIILKANGLHVLSDSVTTLCALLGVVAVSFTGYLWIDLLIALGGAVYIFYEGIGLVRASFSGLMDEADLKVDQVVRDVLDEECAEHNCTYHALRHRSEGNRHWLELHLVFKTDASLAEAHEMATHLETKLRDQFSEPIMITTHMEPAKVD